MISGKRAGEFGDLQDGEMLVLGATYEIRPGTAVEAGNARPVRADVGCFNRSLGLVSINLSSTVAGWRFATAAGLFVLALGMPSVRAQTAVEAAVKALPEKAPSVDANPATAETVALGRELFFDKRLSSDNDMSCASCHIPDKAFADGLAKARGAQGRVLSRNTPSLWNLGAYQSYFWDGRAASLEEQALAPIQAADEMGQDLDELESELNGVPGYAARFRKVFGGPVTREGIARALAAYQRSLVTRDSDFDRYLAGDVSALSEDALAGWEIFQEAGCIRCHSGVHFTDNAFHRLGVSFDDEGRGAITGQAEDRYAFRTPGLRDVAKTAPYMHDGSLATLTEVVEFYYRSTPVRAPDGLPLSFEPLSYRSFSEIPLIVAFLNALSGVAQDTGQAHLPSAGEEP